MRTGIRIALLVAVVALLSPQLARADLAAVGPVNPVNGFPLWYRDANGVALQIGLVGDGLAGLSIFGPPDPLNPFSVQIGFDAEAFYWLASADIPLGGRAKQLELLMAVEAAFVNGPTVNGDQTVFARTRINLNVTVVGTYTVTYPFGTKIYNVTVLNPGNPGTPEVRDTVDEILFQTFPPPTPPVTILTTSIGPFLKAVTPAPPPGFLGNPQLLGQTLTGSPTGNNLFRVTGPAGSNLDGLGGTSVQTDQFVISAQAFNAAPVAQNQAVTAAPAVATPITLVATDADAPAQTLTYTLLTQPLNGTLTLFNPATGTVTYTANAGFTGADAFTFSANDGVVDSNVATVSITVSAAVNVAPTATPQTLTTAAGTPLAITLAAVDADGPAPLTFAIATQPLGGTLGVLAGAAVTYTPNAGFTGADSFTFTAADAAVPPGVSAPATISITVGAAANVPPTATPQTLTTAAGTPLAITLAAVDADGPAPLTFAIATQPLGGTLSAVAGAAVTYTPNAGFAGADSFTFTAADAAVPPGVSAPATVSITVGAAANLAPTATPQTLTTPVDTPLAITLAAVDADGPPPLTFAIVTQPASGTLGVLDPATGAVTFTPAAGFNGAASFTFTAADAAVPPAVSAPATVSITVGTPPPPPPGGGGGVPPPADADKDGIRDTLDNCKNVANANQLDADEDGMGDACDNCPDVANAPDGNAGQPDGDADGVGDVCDNAPEDPNEDQADNDEDGVGDVADGCPNDGGKQGPGTCGCGVADDDTDGDTVEDCIDQAPGVDDNLDTDGDGVRDLEDNCPTTANADQADDNGDNQGNACEPAAQPLPLFPQLCGAGAAQMTLMGLFGLLALRLIPRRRPG